MSLTAESPRAVRLRQEGDFSTILLRVGTCNNSFVSLNDLFPMQSRIKGNLSEVTFLKFSSVRRPVSTGNKNVIAARLEANLTRNSSRCGDSAPGVSPAQAQQNSSLIRFSVGFERMTGQG